MPGHPYFKTEKSLFLPYISQCHLIELSGSLLQQGHVCRTWHSTGLRRLLRKEKALSHQHAVEFMLCWGSTSSVNAQELHALLGDMGFRYAPRLAWQDFPPTLQKLCTYVKGCRLQRTTSKCTKRCLRPEFLLGLSSGLPNFHNRNFTRVQIKWFNDLFCVSVLNGKNTLG